MSKTQNLSPLDAIFIQSETADMMMHVAGLNIFNMPEGWSPTQLREVIEEFWATEKVYPPFNYQLVKPDNPKALLHQWLEVDDVDLSYHIRRSALPSPADERELGILVSRLHANPLDLRRPLWEMHVIEGLEGNRFAIYFKIHHGLIDGVSGMRMMARSMSTSDSELDKLPVFATPPRPPRKRDKANNLSLTNMLAEGLKTVSAQTKTQVVTLRDLGRSMNGVYERLRGNNEMALPLQAPRSVLNDSITRSRRFATQQFPLSETKALAKSLDCSLNELVLAVCATALRRFLLEMNALPEKPLITTVPMSVRANDDEGGGNQIALLLVSLATDIADPVIRLEEVRRSARAAMSHLKGMSAQAVLAYGTLQQLPWIVQSFTGRLGKDRPNFNVMVSNVPGPKETLYFRGAELKASYPVAMVTPGQALNITLQSYADTLNFGFLGCSKTLPHLQNLALYAADAVDELRAIAAAQTNNQN